jgi:hypothetical protein
VHSTRTRIPIAGMNYTDYIRSHVWRTKARQRKEIDSYQCQVGDLLRKVAELLPSVETWECSEDVDAHHRYYPDQLGEEPLESLITVCIRCHEALTTFERSYRFLHNAQRTADPGKEESNEIHETPNPRSPTFEAAQRDLGEPVESVFKTLERRSEQKKQNNRGLRTDRPHRVLGRSLPPARIPVGERRGISSRDSRGDAAKGPD